jgi:hypothetical protein
MVISYLHDIWLKIKELKCYMESMYDVICMLCKLCLPSISYLHDIWLKIKELKCYMESMYDVTCMLCKLCLPSRWDSFVRIQTAIFHLCVIWNHIQCGFCMLCKCLPHLISFGTYFKLLHKIPIGTSMCMMTILWQLVTMHMKLVHAQSSNVHIGEENGKYSKVDSCCSTTNYFFFNIYIFRET